MDELHRDLAATRGQAEVDPPHPAFAEPPDQPVVADLGRITRLKSFHRYSHSPPTIINRPMSANNQN
jgi:hypothetical protein